MADKKSAYEIGLELRCAAAAAQGLLESFLLTRRDELGPGPCALIQTVIDRLSIANEDAGPVLSRLDM